MARLKADLGLMSFVEIGRRLDPPEPWQRVKKTHDKALQRLREAASPQLKELLAEWRRAKEGYL